MADEIATRAGARNVGDLSVKELKSIFAGEVSKLENKISSSESKLEKKIVDLDSKIDSKISACEAKISEEISRFRDEMSCRIDSNSENLRVVTERVDSVADLVDKNRINLNMREQREREGAFRIFNFKVEDQILKNNAKLADHIFNVLFKPIFQLAVSAGDLKSVPTSPLDIIEMCHPLPSPPPSPTPPPGLPQNVTKIPVIICKLTSRSYKYLIHSHKKVFLTSYNTANTEFKVMLLDDLTRANLNCMSKLRKLPGIDQKSVFFRRNSIRFKLLNSERILVVTNPYGSNIKEMTTHIKT